MTEHESASESSTPLVGDIAGAGRVINSEVAKRVYGDALSPAIKEIGGLAEDTLKAFRLFTAPLQLIAAYQDRFRHFCDRVRAKVPEPEQCDAPPEIARPVMEAFASTSDDSPLMQMFEELMVKAIDKRENKKLSPEFPAIIKSLSPLQALLIADLHTREQFTDDLVDRKKHLIVQRLGANFDFGLFGGQDHHLTLAQNLKEKNIVAILGNQPIDSAQYPDLTVPDGLRLQRTRFRLTMFGRWFAASCTPK